MKHWQSLLGLTLLQANLAHAGWVRISARGAEKISTRTQELWNTSFDRRLGMAVRTRIVLADGTKLNRCEYAGEGESPQGCPKTEDGLGFPALLAQAQAGVPLTEPILKSEICDAQGSCKRVWENWHYRISLLLVTGQSGEILSFQIIKETI